MKNKVIEILKKFGGLVIGAEQGEHGYPSAEIFATLIDSLYSGDESEESLQQDFKDWLGWNDKEAPNEDDPDYYTYSWGRKVWINSQKYYKK